ncbi:MAG: c-type cytochrome [Candidatus Solibacter sp.]|jgi:cytochrome c2
MADDDKLEAAGPAKTPDPVVDGSLSGQIVVFSVLLFFSLVWALFDEIGFERPWKRYQQQFTKLYAAHLKKLRPRQAAAENAVYASPEYKRLDQQIQAAERTAAARLAAIDKELAEIRGQLVAIKDPFQDARAKIASLTYELDHASSERGKQSIRQDIDQTRRAAMKLDLPAGGGRQGTVRQELSFEAVDKLFISLKAREAQLTAEQNNLSKEARELRRQRAEYQGDHLDGLTQQQIDGLLRKTQAFVVEIKQIHVEEAGLVERCESCHLGIREPLVLTAADMGGQRLFISHPNKPLMTLHDVERFGCTPCHNGNGRATSSVEKAHGNNEHWLWPMFPAANTEAGCVQCHSGDRVLEFAPVLTRGRDLFQVRGCMGCHRHESFDREADALTTTTKEIQTLVTRQKDARIEADREVKLGDAADTDENAKKHFATAEYLRIGASNIEAKVAELESKAKFLMQDVKKVGPNLKDVRLKLRKEWIPVWLKDPQAFRPGTKMPSFRLSGDEIRALSAFVWQSGWTGPAAPQEKPGDAARGKELFETRGCLACHSMGEGGSRMGGDFAANLSRVGEKNGYDYVVRWVHNPRQRTRPYCPREAKDLGPEDYAKNGLPFVFDLEHSQCPNDGAELQVQNMTVMPSLRLTAEEARDIASYLVSRRHADADYPDAAFMDDPQLAQRGRQLVARYGCASCHEIRSLEDAPRIGTELTKEASKPMEQLDFGLLEHKAKEEEWYTHKGFFEHKLENPAVYDQGRQRAPEDQLRMPKINLATDDIRALTTLLLGSVDSPFFGEFESIPASFRYIPTDQQRDIQEGWWLVKKYNCMGCHELQAGQKSILSGLPRYQDPDWKEQIPPALLQEGARVDPAWLTRFLDNPSLNAKKEGNGVRTYLHARMPTFSFSTHEIQILTRFFMARAAQSAPYIAEQLVPLGEEERTLARALFTSTAAPCLKCHLVGDANRDRFATAPSFLVARERLKPTWTARWMLDPQAISPGTAMPSGLFRRDGARWVFAGPTPEAFQKFKGDHVQLLVRYMFQITPEEQRRLTQMLPARGK